MNNKGMKSPLARARGLGASRATVGGWITLRVTGMAIFLLAAWFVWFLLQIVGADYETFTEKLADPRNAIMMILFIIAVFYHARLGCREIIEDYVTGEYCKVFKLIGLYLFYFAAAIACIFSVLKIAFTA